MAATCRDRGRSSCRGLQGPSWYAHYLVDQGRTALAIRVSCRRRRVRGCSGIACRTCAPCSAGCGMAIQEWYKSGAIRAWPPRHPMGGDWISNGHPMGGAPAVVASIFSSPCVRIITKSAAERYRWRHNDAALAADQRDGDTIGSLPHRRQDEEGRDPPSIPLRALRAMALVVTRRPRHRSTLTAIKLMKDDTGTLEIARSPPLPEAFVEAVGQRLRCGRAWELGWRRRMRWAARHGWAWRWWR